MLNDPTAKALSEVASAISDLGTELHEAFIGSPQALKALADVTALAAIAQYGNEEERRIAIDALKGLQYDVFDR